MSASVKPSPFDSQVDPRVVNPTVSEWGAQLESAYT